MSVNIIREKYPDFGPTLYAIKTPNAWSQHQYKFTGFSYFLLVNNENKLAEFRPKCFHQLKLALPEIVLNVTTQSNSESIKHEKQCFRWLEGYSACLVRSKKPEKEAASRWRWFAVNPKLQHGTLRVTTLRRNLVQFVLHQPIGCRIANNNTTRIVIHQ